VILHPAIIALVLGSLLISDMLLYAAWYGVKILRAGTFSGSEQLSLERRTYLISP
jgi:hypothetical protein